MVALSLALTPGGVRISAAPPPAHVQVVCDWKAVASRLGNVVSMLDEVTIERHQLGLFRDKPSTEPLELLVRSMFAITQEVRQVRVFAEFGYSPLVLAEKPRLLAMPPGTGRLEVELRLHPHLSAHLIVLVEPPTALVKSRDLVMEGLSAATTKLRRIEPEVAVVEDASMRRLRLRREKIAAYLALAHKKLGKGKVLTDEEFVLVVTKAVVDSALRFSVVSQVSLRDMLLDTNRELVRNEQRAGDLMSIPLRHGFLALNVKRQITFTEAGLKYLAQAFGI